MVTSQHSTNSVNNIADLVDCFKNVKITKRPIQLTLGQRTTTERWESGLKLDMNSLSLSAVYTCTWNSKYYHFDYTRHASCMRL